MGSSLSLQKVIRAWSRPTSVRMTAEKLNTRKSGDFTSRPTDVFCVNGTIEKTTRSNLWICCIATAVHDAVNGLRECANVEHRSRSCPPRQRHHRSFVLRVRTSACG